MARPSEGSCRQSGAGWWRHHELACGGARTCSGSGSARASTCRVAPRARRATRWARRCQTGPARPDGLGTCVFRRCPMPCFAGSLPYVFTEPSRQSTSATPSSRSSEPGDAARRPGTAPRPPGPRASWCADRGAPPAATEHGRQPEIVTLAAGRASPSVRNTECGGRSVYKRGSLQPRLRTHLYGVLCTESVRRVYGECTPCSVQFTRRFRALAWAAWRPFHPQIRRERV